MRKDWNLQNYLYKWHFKTFSNVKMRFDVQPFMPSVGFRCVWMREQILTAEARVKGSTQIWVWPPCLWRIPVSSERRTALHSHPTAPCLRRKRSRDCFFSFGNLQYLLTSLRHHASFFLSQMVIPADPEEMKEFQSQCICQCQYVVDITFPVAFILLPSKEAFQSIYNR